MSSRPSRTVDLACDRALVGLDPAAERELGALLGPADDLPLRLEHAAAAVALAELAIDEPLPDHLAAAVLAQATMALPRTPAGTVPMSSASAAASAAAWRSEARTAVMAPRGPQLVVPAGPRPQVSDRGDAPRAANDQGPAVAGPARGRSIAAWAGWIAAAACLALAIGSFVLRRGPGDGPVVADAAPSPAERRDRLIAEAKDVIRTPWAATTDPAGKGEQGEVVWSTSRQEGYMTFRGLAANDPRREQYQLWIFDRERDERYPVDGGVFDVGPGGEVVVPITARVPVGTPTLFAVTVEPPGGVVVSKRERIVVTADG